jgi:hypothetical protein
VLDGVHEPLFKGDAHGESAVLVEPVTCDGGHHLPLHVAGGDEV